MISYFTIDIQDVDFVSPALAAMKEGPSTGGDAIPLACCTRDA